MGWFIFALFSCVRASLNQPARSLSARTNTKSNARARLASNPWSQVSKLVLQPLNNQPDMRAVPHNADAAPHLPGDEAAATNVEESSALIDALFDAPNWSDADTGKRKPKSKWR